MNRITVDSPIGPITLVATEDAIVGCYMANAEAPDVPEKKTKLLARAEKELREYFSGKRERFELPLEPAGTDFQRAVWGELQRIPFGSTRTYAQIAQKIGRPKAVRAVGAANGSNPIAVIIPCHRVIGADGSLTGFGGGLPRKKWLLSHENPQPQLGFD